MLLLEPIVARELRDQFRFEITRLRVAAQRLQTVDERLRDLRIRLEQRAIELSNEADGGPPDAIGGGYEEGDVQVVTLRAAQAQATAELARKSALGEVLRHTGALSLVVSMAVSRWIDAILTSLAPVVGDKFSHEEASRREALVRSHLHAGRLAHRMLMTLRRKSGLRSGCGLVVCSLVVAELAPPDLEPFLEEQIDEGWRRAQTARGVRSEQQAREAISAALREGAYLLERMATKAEAAAQQLVIEESSVESKVQLHLSLSGRSKHYL